jgi:hypothetical protein
MNPDPKTKTPRSQKYLDWLKTQRCVICSHPKEPNRDIVPAHQTILGRGMAHKPSDYTSLPLCSFCHAEEHWHGTETMWKGIDRKREVIKHSHTPY